MPRAVQAAAPKPLDAFIALCGETAWSGRMAALAGRMQPGSLSARAAQHRHALELALARMADGRALARAAPAEQRLCGFARDAVALAETLPPAARERLRARLQAGLTGEATLLPLFHLLRTAARLRAQGFALRFDGLAEEAPYDLLARRGGATAEVVCETVSAEEGRPVHRGDWLALVDRIHPELQTWLAAHPGRYLLKLTLPEGISGPEQLAGLQQRISEMLAAEKRQDAGADAMLKLDPLVLAGAQLQDAPSGLPARLRQIFGHEAHLAVTTEASSGSVFAMAARAGRGNEISGAVCRRLTATAAARLSGQHPGILAVFLEEVERGEWRALREELELEGAVRRWFTGAAAAGVVAVSCTSRFEMFGAADAAGEEELRFRNPRHPAARHPDLSPAILSSL
ncbi:hypothetical protein JYK14_20600 [Siccirubricoccus sp. KC 17139]|uniref:Uncharacterized protein n=1 Tax=Siccirubricoccus soli TaxID=2899147 RepID=A0ABT1DBK8_9PROT|nr:hypothetical protein [Siccirubricoccus soli]MCO6418544.1 hypothetical protein [Siccirubricoccus soli]MCP2684679.1 hypothetical protein [Siccirubricoccus soli]